MDPNASIAEIFSSVLYDGGLSTSVLSSQDKPPNKFNVGDTVYVRLEDESDVVTGIVETPPTSMSDYYTIRLEHGVLVHVKDADVFFEEAAPVVTPSISLGFFTPELLKKGCQVTLLHDDLYKRGYLELDADNDWEFVTRNIEGQIVEAIPLSWTWPTRGNIDCRRTP